MFGGPHAGLPDMLSAREARAERQRKLLAERGLPLISFTLNIAGPVKICPFARLAYEEGRQYILDCLSARGIRCFPPEETEAVSGYELLLAVDAPAERLKEWMARIEEKHPIGRLFDIDVLNTDGEKLSRSAPGDGAGGARKCLICGGPVFFCARSRAHSPEELRAKTAEILWGYFSRKNARYIADTAVRALLTEVSVTPKPGLVDRADSGAHRDMDFFSFLDSAGALHGYFEDAAMLGQEYAAGLRKAAGSGDGSPGPGPEGAFPELRFMGQHAEAEMLRATGGVNTHKGAIFSIGLFACAAGMLAVRHGLRFPEENAETLCRELQEILRALALPVRGDFGTVHSNAGPSFGESLYAATRRQGVRGEALAGFPSVFDTALPVLRGMLAEPAGAEARTGERLNRAALCALLALMAHSEDTNMIRRGGQEEAERRKAEAAELLACLRQDGAAAADAAYAADTAHAARAGEAGGERAEDVLLRRMEELNREYIARNLSPGGAADMLSAALFTRFLLG